VQCKPENAVHDCETLPNSNLSKFKLYKLRL